MKRPVFNRVLILCTVLMVGWFVDREMHFFSRTLVHESSSDSQSIKSVFSPHKIFQQISSFQATQDEREIIETILTVVKSYYVNQDKVSNIKLFEAFLQGNHLEGVLQVSMTSDSYLIRHNDLKLEVKRQDDYTDEKFTDQIMDILGLVIDSSAQKQASARREKLAHMMDAMLQALDPHSALLLKKDYEELLRGTEGSFGGLGIVVGVRNRVLTVIKPLPNSPASRAGIKAHDRILQINDQQTFGKSLDDLVQLMRGAPGTRVRLMVLSRGHLAPRLVEIDRDFITVDSVSVTTHQIKSHIYMRLAIENFARRTSDEIVKALRLFRLKHQRSPDGIILDLRSNPGGLLDQAVAVSDLFIRQGVIVSTKGQREEVELATVDGSDVVTPLLVLINNDSASASEIVAGALQDHDRAIVVGTPSYGKASVQKVFELTDDIAMKLTVSRYYTPLGHLIQNRGIMPDIWLQPIDETAEANKNILGSYRYLKEGNLPFHLDNPETEPASDFSDQSKSVPHAYYLAKLYRDEGDPDKLLDYAWLFLEQINELSTKESRGSVFSARVWLSQLMTYVSQKMQSEQKKVKQFLQERFQVNWEKNPKSSEQLETLKDVDFNIVQEPTNHENTGRVQVRWQLNNNSKNDLYRVSVYLQSLAGRTLPEEVLVGQVPAGMMRSGHFVVDPPADWQQRQVTSLSGVAIDAVPILQDSFRKAVPLMIPDHVWSLLSAEIIYDDVGHGAVDGYLEPLEEAMLRIVVRNESNQVARNISVELTNLSGRQLLLEDENKSLDRLMPGGQKEVHFPVKAMKQLKTSELALGVRITSDDLKEPVVRLFHITSTVNYKEFVPFRGRESAKSPGTEAH